MTSQAHKAHHNPLFSLFGKTEGFEWMHRAMAKALLDTQENTSAHIIAYRKLVDDVREMVRKEQDLALELSRKACKRMAEGSRPATPDMSEMGGIFGRALTGMREFNETWMNVQQRSFDTMRSQASDGLKKNSERWSNMVVAAGRTTEKDAKRHSASQPGESRTRHH